jgi:transmembrane sensor
MDPVESFTEPDVAIRDAAARWVVRKDRGLSAEETAEWQRWRAADPRHAAAFERSVGSWRTFRELGAAVRRSPEPRAVERATWQGWGIWALATAAAVAFAIWIYDGVGRQKPDTTAVAEQRAGVATRRLADGSWARLKAGAEIVELYSAKERRVRLVRGEVFFTVEKDAARPFYVEVGRVTVRAVGTAFAVRFAPDAVDVLVTEGTVQVTPPEAAPPALVTAGQRGQVARTDDTVVTAVVVSRVSAEEIARSLGWNDPTLDLSGSPLKEWVEALARRSGRRIELGDADLGEVHIGGSFPPDDVDGFVRALEQIYNVKIERRTDGVIVLRKAR